MRPARLLHVALLALLLAGAAPAYAVDPPYEAEMERLAEIMGSLYFLDPLCRPAATSDWRGEMGELIGLDQPDDDRRQRLSGAFNGGYESYARLYRACTMSADTARRKLLVEAEAAARDIHTRFAE